MSRVPIVVSLKPPCVVLAIVATAAAGFGLQRQETATFQEVAIAARPIDLSIDSVRNVSVVRAASASGTTSDGVSLWRLASGARILPANPPAVPAGWDVPGAPFPSDLVATAATRAVIIGSTGPAAPALQDTTFISTLSFNSSAAAFNLTFTQPATPGNSLTDAGFAHDVAITPDNLRAVVHSRNWVHVVNLTTNTIQLAVNIGTNPLFASGTSPLDNASAAGQPQRPGAVDSVEVTNTFAVVIANRFMGSPPVARGSAFLIPLTSPTPTFLEFPLDQGGLPAGRKNRVHDLKITPDGTKAIVNSDNTVMFLDLTTSQLLAERIHGPGSPDVNYTDTVDSVETSDKFAVVLVDARGGPLFGQRRYNAEIYDLTPSIPLVKTVFPSSAATWNPSRDVELTPDGTKVIVRADIEAAVVDLTSPGFSHVYFSTPGVAALAQTVGNTARMSDLLVVDDNFAYTTSMTTAPSMSGGFLSYLDLTTVTPNPFPANFLPISGGTGGPFHPVDITLVGRRIVVKNTVTGSTPGAVMVFDTSTVPQLLASFALSGFQPIESATATFSVDLVATSSTDISCIGTTGTGGVHDRIQLP
jgi:hypothetical protein